MVSGIGWVPGSKDGTAAGSSTGSWAGTAAGSWDGTAVGSTVSYDGTAAGSAVKLAVLPWCYGVHEDLLLVVQAKYADVAREKALAT
jgi:hypothetical protein